MSRGGDSGEGTCHPMDAGHAGVSEGNTGTSHCMPFPWGWCPGHVCKLALSWAPFPIPPWLVTHFPWGVLWSFYPGITI